jgi:hypothetical protein
MNIDFTVLPNWLQTSLLWAAIIVAAITFIVTVMGFFKKVWPVLKAIVERENFLAELPAFMVKTTASLAAQDDALALQNSKIDEIHHETHNNDGSSIKDTADRLELGVKGIYERLDKSDHEQAALRLDLEITRPRPIRKRAPPKPKEIKP